MSPGDYKTFIGEVLEREFIAAITVQGYEPLLPESLEYTVAILESGQEHQIPTSIVTNGTHLKKAIRNLASLDLHDIAVSLDAAKADVHDHLRGRQGAFDNAVQGLEHAVEALPLTKITVTSVLIPRNLAHLKEMPSLLASIGIDRWVVNPLHKVGRGAIGGPVGKSSEILKDLLVLREDARNLGIEFIVDDEFGALADTLHREYFSDAKPLNIRQLQRPSSVSRLLPTGECSIGADIDREMPIIAPHWAPNRLHAGDFIQALRN